MRATIEIDDDLLREARRLTKVRHTRALVHEALRPFVLDTALRQIAALGGTMPGLKVAPRRRFRGKRNRVGRPHVRAAKRSSGRS